MCLELLGAANTYEVHDLITICHRALESAVHASTIYPILSTAKLYQDEWLLEKACDFMVGLPCDDFASVLGPQGRRVNAFTSSGTPVISGEVWASILSRRSPTPLSVAVEFQMETTVAALLRQGARVDVPGDT